MNDLVRRLCKEQSVKIELRPEPKLEFFKEAIDKGYVHITFVETGTELGVRMERDACALSELDWEKRAGTAKIVGTLVLNYVRVRCLASIDLETLCGQGKLEVIEETTPAQLAKERMARTR